MAKLCAAVLFLFFTLSFARTPLTQPGNGVTNLKLPSEKDVILPELPHTLPESDDSTPTSTLPSKSDHEETRSVHPVPLTLVRFRPINRRFRLRYSLPFRLCHHLKTGSQRQIPFGNDMIVPSKRNIDFDKFVYRIGVRQIPSDRFSFRHLQHSDKTIWKFLYNRERFGEMKWKDQLPHHHPHHHYDENEDNDHEQRKISKFQIMPENQGKYGEVESKNENQFHTHHVNDESDERSKLYAKHYEMKLRKRFHYNNGEEEAKEENKWHKMEKKKGGFMRGIRKFLHHYFD